MEIKLLCIASGQFDGDISIGMIKLRCCAMNEVEAVLGVLFSLLWDIDEELLLIEHVV